MKVIKRTPAPAGLVAMDCVGSTQTVLVWNRGVSNGRVIAAQLVEDAAYVDLVVEYDAPPLEVASMLCERMESCRLDPACRWAESCAQHDGVENA